MSVGIVKNLEKVKTKCGKGQKDLFPVYSTSNVLKYLTIHNKETSVKSLINE